jgi:hypothetical protein
MIKIMVGLALSALVSIVPTAKSSTITLNELKQRVVEDQNIISTAHITYIREKTDNFMTDEVISSKRGNPNVTEANRHIITEEEIFLDNITGARKVIVNDIRDINELMAKYNVQDTKLNKLRLDKSNIFLYQNGYAFTFMPGIFRGNP